MHLRSEFNSKVTEKCLRLSFLSGKDQIINECLSYQEPNQKCMEYAIFSYNKDLIMLLANNYKIQIDKDICARSYNVEALALLMEQTSDYDKILPFAIKFRSLELMKYLSPLVRNINAQDIGGWTALGLATFYNCYDILEYLISIGANVNIAKNDGKTPLMVAANLNRYEMVQLLVENSADVNAKDNTGLCPLHYTVKSNNSAIFDYLISHGANIYVEDVQGQTPYDLACEMGKNEIINYIKSKGFNINRLDRFYKAMNDNTGKSPLILAIINNCVDVARNLLSRGANVNYVDRYGLSPIHYAIKASNYEMLELLVEYGANIN